MQQAMLLQLQIKQEQEEQIRQQSIINSQNQML
jgi:hypothetical protein